MNSNDTIKTTGHSGVRHVQTKRMMQKLFAIFFHCSFLLFLESFALSMVLLSTLNDANVGCSLVYMDNANEIVK